MADFAISSSSSKPSKTQRHTRQFGEPFLKRDVGGDFFKKTQKPSSRFSPPPPTRKRVLKVVQIQVLKVVQIQVLIEWNRIAARGYLSICRHLYSIYFVPFL